MQDGLLRVANLLPDDSAVPLTDAMTDVLAERRRQVKAEGWTPEHDDEHDGDEMAIAAACYALPEHVHKFRRQSDERSSERGLSDPDDIITRKVPKLWPETWACWWWKPKSRRIDLVRAAALLIAEIERLDRMNTRNSAS